MANLNTAQIAHSLLGGQSQRLYHQNLKVIVTHGSNILENPNPHNDVLGAGDFEFINTNPPGQNPTHSYEQKGLLTSVKRPLDDKGYGHHAAVHLQNTVLPDRFVLTATFVEPKQEPGNITPPSGTYAAVLLLSNSTTLPIGCGATTQFSGTGQRLNSPGLKTPPNRSDIDASLYQQVINVQNPSTFTLVLRVERGTVNSNGHAKLFVGDVEADSFDFTFDFKDGSTLTTATVLDNIRFGIHTANGSDYRASVYVTGFEIWAPISGPHWMRAVHSRRYAHIEDPSSGHQLMQWDWDANDNQQFKFEQLINRDTGEVYYHISVDSGKRLQDDGPDGSGNRRITLSTSLNDSDNQKWKLIPANDPADGSFFIQSKSSGWVMDVKGGSTEKGARVIQWHLSGFANQRWILIPRQAEANVEGSADAKSRSRR